MSRLVAVKHNVIIGVKFVILTIVYLQFNKIIVT